jgi:pyrroloquinoline quinone biosynthesis protein B
MTKQLLLIFCFSLLCSNTAIKSNKKTSLSKQYITVLGIAQDAGYPHIGCQKFCYVALYKDKCKKQRFSILYLLDGKKISSVIMREINPDSISSMHVIKDAEKMKTYTQEQYSSILLIHLKKQ